MLPRGDGRHGRNDPPVAGSALGTAAGTLLGEVRLPPLLQQLLAQSRHLLGAAAGSISLVDGCGSRYGKVAEHGAACQLGQSFPLDEGVTGQVVGRRRPVVLDRYSDLHAGHLPPAHPASAGAVAAVPIWWRGDVIGANVVFAGERRRFAADEVDLEVLTQLAAPAIVRAGSGRGAWTSVREPAAPPPFSARERDVIALLAQGRGDREIARALAISRRTVEKHVGSVLRKTGTPSRTAAVLRCLERGWVTPPPA